MTTKLFFKTLNLEARTTMSYRFDFWISAVIGFIAEFGAVWFLWNAVFKESNSDVIGGYSLSSMYIYYLTVILISKIVRGSRSKNDIASDIYQGNLNKYLLFPVNYILYKYAQHLGVMFPSFIQFFLFGVVVILVIDLPNDINLSFTSIFMALITIFIANILYFLMNYMLKLTAFWIDNVWSLDAFKWFIVSLLGGYMLPISVFPKNLQIVLNYLPFKFLFDFPVNTLFGKIGVEIWVKEIAISLIWCLFFLIVCRLVWKKGRLQYTGVGI